MAEPLNRQLVLVARPKGDVGPECFELRRGEIPVPKPGEALVRVRWLGIDATQRTWLNADGPYASPARLGAVMTGSGVGEIVASDAPHLTVGDWVAGPVGWQDYAIAGGEGLFGLNKVPDGIEPRDMLHVFGVNGLTAYIGLTGIGRPRAGETVFVTGAAGGVGSIACQIARLLGCRVIGSAGGAAKCAWLRDVARLDACIDHRREDMRAKLAQYAPKGIDVVFDNTGGPALEAALDHIAIGARIVLCGSIASGYRDGDYGQGPRNYMQLAFRRARMEGFIFLDHVETFPAAFADLSRWRAAGEIVDVHGDTVERIVMPRPGVTFPLSLALDEADRQMLSNGITTAFHGLTISWEPGLRSLAAARAFVEALERARLACDTRINFRWETFALDAMNEVVSWFTCLPGGIFSLNDHTTTHLDLPPSSRKIIRMAERNGFSPEECLARLAQVATRATEVPAATLRMTQAARDVGMPIFAHDEVSPAMREKNRALGIRVSEFPMTADTARSARQAGEHVVLGAPNVLRGGSHNKAVDAAPAIREGLGTVLASDYYYPSQLHAAFALADQGLPFTQAWRCVSASAADAAGLKDRGRLEIGLRADVIAVCPNARRVHTVFIAGERRLYLG